MSQRFHSREQLLQPQHQWWHGLKLSTQKFAILLSVMAFVMGFSYVWLTNATAATGFAIEKLQNHVAELQGQNEKLEIKAADLQALSSVELSSQTLDLQPTDSFEVLTTTAGAVAVGR